jgi:hypothetical protein
MAAVALMVMEVLTLSRGIPLQEVFIAFVGLLRGGKARILAHGPDPPPVHGRLNPAGKWIFSRKSQLTGIIEFRNIARRVEDVDVHSRGALNPFRSLFQTTFFPAFFLVQNFLLVHLAFFLRLDALPIVSAARKGAIVCENRGYLKPMWRNLQEVITPGRAGGLENRESLKADYK